MPKITKVSIDTFEGDALKAELKRLQEKLEHQRNLARLRSARYYAKRGKIKNPADRKKPGRKPKPKHPNDINDILEPNFEV